MQPAVSVGHCGLQVVIPHDPSEWIPFGGGAGFCLGAALAALEIETVPSTMLATVWLSVAAPQPEAARLAGTLSALVRGATVVTSQPAGLEEHAGDAQLGRYSGGRHLAPALPDHSPRLHSPAQCG